MRIKLIKHRVGRLRLELVDMSKQFSHRPHTRETSCWQLCWPMSAPSPSVCDVTCARWRNCHLPSAIVNAVANGCTIFRGLFVTQVPLHGLGE